MKSIQFLNYLKWQLVCTFIFPAFISGQDNKGNPLPHFLFPSFMEGEVQMKDGQRFPAILNYNMVEEKMITELNGVYRYSKNPSLIDKITIGDRTFVPVGDVFYEVLSSGEITIFLQNKSNLNLLGTDVGYGVRSRSVPPTHFRRFELSNVIYEYGEVAYTKLPPNVEIIPASVYWVGVGNTVQKFSNESKLLKIFPGHKRSLRSFIRNNSLNVRLREDVIKIGNYLNNTMKGEKRYP
jgi:hypothetical protein